MQKDGKFQGVNLIGNPGRSTSKISIFSTELGGLQFFSGKAQYRLVICANVVRCWHMTYIIYFDFVLIYNHLFCTQTTCVSYQTSKCRYSKKRKSTGKKRLPRKFCFRILKGNIFPHKIPCTDFLLNSDCLLVQPCYCWTLLCAKVF